MSKFELSSDFSKWVGEDLRFQEYIKREMNPKYGDSRFGEHMEILADRERFAPAEKPDDTCGVDASFVAHFINEQMEAIFPAAVREFLENEPLLRDPDRRSVFLFCVMPVHKAKKLTDPYHFLVLDMMLIAAREGSIFSKNLILNLYKRCYKKEYNILKRVRKLSFYDYMEMFGSELDTEDNELMDAAVSRFYTICELLEIELDGMWYRSVLIQNDDYIRDITFCRVIEKTSFTSSVQEARQERFREAASWLEEHYTEEEWEELRGAPHARKNSGTSVIGFLQNLVEHAFDRYGTFSDLLDLEKDFDPFRWSAEVIAHTDEKYYPEQMTLENLTAAAALMYTADRFASLLKIREGELLETLDVDLDEIVNDEDLFAEEKDDAAAQLHQVYVKDQKASQKERELQEDLHKKLEGSLVSREDRPCGSQVLAIHELVSKIYDDTRRERSSDCADLELRLKKMQQKLEAAEREVVLQRSLYEDEREKARRLQKKLDDSRNMRAELTALRSFAYHLQEEESDLPVTEAGREEMISVLKHHHVTIVGGHENWVKKMRRMLPEWTYIAANDSVSSIEGPIRSSEIIYFYTDILSHSMYQKFLKAASEQEVPYSYLHGTNIEQVMRKLYEELHKTDVGVY